MLNRRHTRIMFGKTSNTQVLTDVCSLGAIINHHLSKTLRTLCYLFVRVIFLCYLSPFKRLTPKRKLNIYVKEVLVLTCKLFLSLDHYVIYAMSCKSHTFLISTDNRLF